LFRSSRFAASAATRRDAAGVLVATALVAILYFPSWPLVSSASLDESWRLGLSLAHSLGLQWGTDVVFTFGPLYFLDFPLAADRVAVLGAALSWLGYVLVLVATVFAIVRRSQPAWTPLNQLATVGFATAALVVMPVGATFQQMHVLLPMVVVVVLAAVAFRLERLAWLAGALVGLLLLHKLSDAALAGGFGAVALTATYGWRGAVRFGVAALVAILVGWLLAGQPLTGIPAFVSAEIEIIRGYGVAMATQDFTLLWQYPLAIVVGLLVLAAFAIASGSLGLARWPRIGLVLAAVWALWIAGKEGFTRHDGHYWYFFGIVFILSIGLVLAAPSRRVLRLCVVTGVVGYLLVSSTYMQVLAPVERTDSVRGLMRVIGVIGNERAGTQIVDRNANELRTSFGVTPELVAALGTAPTVVEPWQITALTVTGATWDPTPVIQLYASYTPALDALNAASLQDRPRQVLRGQPNFAIDGRFPLWESPTYERLVYCAYEVGYTAPSWLLLRPATDRCVDELPGDTVEATANQQIDVPARPGAITLATITPHRSIFETVFDIAAKPFPTWVSYGGQDWRLPYTPYAPDLMLNVPVAHPAFAELPAAPYATISVTRPSTIEFSFVEVR
jgi:hypothetical protein